MERSLTCTTAAWIDYTARVAVKTRCLNMCLSMFSLCLENFRWIPCIMLLLFLERVVMEWWTMFQVSLWVQSLTCFCLFSTLLICGQFRKILEIITYKYDCVSISTKFNVWRRGKQELRRVILIFHPVHALSKHSCERFFSSLIYSPVFSKSLMTLLVSH